MNLVALLRFFYRGPGLILVVVGAIIAVGWVIKQGQDRERARADERQVHRDLGKVNPKTEVDQSQVAKETILSVAGLFQEPRRKLKRNLRQFQTFRSSSARNRCLRS